MSLIKAQNPVRLVQIAGVAVSLVFLAELSSAQVMPRVRRQEIKSEAYKNPLSFDVADAMTPLPLLEVDYDLSQNEGQTLRIGNVEITESSFLFALRTVGQLFPHLKGVVSDRELNQSILAVRWPESLFKEGLLEMISREGKVIWKFDLNQKVLAQWRSQIADWANRGNNSASSTSTPSSGAYNIQMGFVDPRSFDIPLQGRQFFRFCLTQSVERAQSKLCSRRYGTKGAGAKMIMGKVKFEGKARVFIENEDAPLQGGVPASLDLPTRFYADLSSGESYEFVAQAKKTQLMEIYQLPNKPESVQVIGTSLPPNQPYGILNPEEQSKFIEWIGFQSTIKDPRKFWSTEVSMKNAVLFFPGIGGGMFRQKLNLQAVPLAEMRPYLATRTPLGTYLKNPVLHGLKAPEVQVMSVEGGGEVKTLQSSAQQSASQRNATLFDWTFVAPEKGNMNRSYLGLSYGKQKTRAYYELYRGYGNELSFRLSGIVSAGQGMIMGETAFNHWFEEIFSSENYWLSKQRWGVSGKYFKSLTPLQFEQATAANLEVLTFDLKFRFTPGLWTREESMGMMASYQSVGFEQLKAQMLGAGWFWARSMPKVFDDILNYIPGMNFPKWVDMEFIYYPGSMDSKIKADVNYALNFHGQVLWKKWLFGEAGFGVKRYAFLDTSLNQQAELNTFYGTVGLGMKF